MKTRLLIAAATLGLALPLGVPVAQAVPPDENDHYSFSDSANYRDCGLRIHEDITGGGHFMLFPIPESNGQAWLAHDNYSNVRTLTNRDTGAWFTISARGIFKEMTGTHVSGDLWRFTAHEAGQPFVVRDSDGNVVLRDRGLIRYDAVFDTFGDGEPGGEPVSEEPPVVSGPHPGFEADYCEMVVDLIG